MKKSRAIIYVIQNAGGMIWGAALDARKAQAEIESLKEIYDDNFYIVKTDILDLMCESR